MNPKQKSAKTKKVKKLMSEISKTKYANRAVNQKEKITARVMNKTGRNIKGRGAYSLSDLWNTVSTPFRHEQQEGSGRLNNLVRGGAEALGKELSGSSTVGRYLGNAASWLTKLMGSGTYTIKGNTLMDPSIATFKPSASTVITHREFVADITGSTTFANTAYLLNPGNATLFPWLSTLALNFEQYEWLGLAFEFRSTCAFTSATGNLGAVVMATDYDVLDADFNTKRAMEIADFSGSSSPVNSFYHFVECEPQQSVLRQMYVQQGNNIAAYPDDARFSIPGRFQLGTQGMPSAFIIGELWVTYHVKFMRPTIAPSLSVSQGIWARYQSVVLPSVTTLPVFLENTGGTAGLGTVAPWTKSPATYVTGISFTGFQPGDYIANIVTKRSGTDLGSTVDIGATVVTGGATSFFTAYDSALTLQAQALDTRGTATGGYTDTKVGSISFTMASTTSFVGFPFVFWDLRNNGVTVVVTKASGVALDQRKSRLDQRIQLAVDAALAHGKDEAGPSHRPPVLEEVDETDMGEHGLSYIQEYSCVPRLVRQDATSGPSSSSSSTPIGSRSSSKK
jgi:hypothetical protein